MSRTDTMGAQQFFLSPTFAAYISSTGRCSPERNFRALSMGELQEVVTALLKPNRVAHVLGCRDTAVALAKHWGADETDAGPTRRCPRP